jgi:putative NIF3 family GTP cyclohydrolase 1 type 2
MNHFSRREFLAAGGAYLSSHAVAPASAGPTTVGSVLSRIREQIGIPWREKTVDNLLTGTADTPVRGIATTMMATLDVVQRSVAQGRNLIVTHETPFYLHQDQTDDIKNDPVLQFKLDYCKKHDVAIFHFHDHWHAFHPDGIAQGMINQLGWQSHVADAANPKRLMFNSVPLRVIASHLQTVLGAETIRVLGDPDLPVKNVQTNWGYCGRENGIKIFAQPDIDVLICGETREWELVEYCQDSVQSGNKKALIVVGHVLSEQGGMIQCRDWLRGFVPEVPVDFVPAKEPFWIPQHPRKI